MTASLEAFRGLPLLIFPGFIYALMGTSPHNSLGGMPITAAALSISNINIQDEYYPDLQFNKSHVLTSDEQYFIHLRISTGIAFVSGCILVSLLCRKIEIFALLKFAD
jgi:MFS superfamily sulfate permease-like transporter